eukprot:497467-Pelagomonas_calceolata.AAC.3
MNFFPGPPWTCALSGVAATWQQCQLRRQELPGCPGRRSGAWFDKPRSNPCLGQPAHPVVK